MKVNLKLVLSLCLITLMVTNLFPLNAMADIMSKTSIYDDIVYLKEAPPEHANSLLEDADLLEAITAGSAIISEPVAIEELLPSKQSASPGDSTAKTIQDGLKAEADFSIVVEIGDIIFKAIPENEINIVQSEQKEMPSNKVSIASADSCDIFARDLVVKPGANYPFIMGEAAYMQFVIGNYGPDTAMGVGFSVYVNNMPADSYSTGVLPGNTQGIVPISVNLSGGAAGDYTVRIVASAAAPVDANTGNNETSNSFQWLVNSALVDLGIRYGEIINSTSGSAPFETTATQWYQFYVINYGPGATSSPYARLTVVKSDDSGILYSEPLGLPSIPAGYGCTVNWPLNINSSGIYNFTASVYDENRTDPDLGDNYAYNTFTCIPDGCGIWAKTLNCDTRNISISIIDPSIDLADVQAAASDWNGITSQIHISTVGRNLSNPTCIMYLGVVEDGFRGEFIENDKPNTYYSGGTIIINRATYNMPGYEFVDDHVIRHEIGHLISLNHPHMHNPLCEDKAVMQYKANCFSATVTEHDRQALINKWGLQ